MKMKFKFLIMFLFSFGLGLLQSNIVYSQSNPELTLQKDLTTFGAVTVNANVVLYGNVGVGTGALTESFTLEGTDFLQTASNPTLVTGFDMGDDANDLEIVGRYLYAVNDNGAASEFKIYDISDPTSPTAISSGTLAGGGKRIDISGNYAYISSGSTTLTVWDISSPTNPIEVSSVSSGTSFASRLSGNYIYVGLAAGSGKQFLCINISDPLNPRLLGRVSFSTAGAVTNDIAVAGDYAFASIAGNGVDIINVADPENPAQVANIATTGIATYVVVSGAYLFVSQQVNAGDEFEIYDISDPKSPTKVGGIETGVTINGIGIAGNYAYVGMTTVIRIYNISDPSNPYEVGSVTSNGFANLEISGNYLYATTADVGGDEVQIYDISAMDAPAATIGSVATNEINVRQNLVIGNRAYVGTVARVGPGGIHTDGPITSGLSVGDNIFVNDVVIGGNVTGGASLDLTPTYVADGTPLLRVRNLTLSDSLYASYNGLVGIGTSSPILPLHVEGDVTVSESVTATAVFLADGTSLPSTQIFEWSDDDTTLTPVDTGRDVHVDANLSVDQNLSANQSAFVEGNMGVGTTVLTEKFNLDRGNFLQTGIRNPVELGFVLDTESPEGGTETAIDNANDIFVSGNYAYITSDDDDALNIIDISNPTSPTLVGSIRDDNSPEGASGATAINGARGVHVAGNYAYVVGATENAMAIIDISNPANPKEVGTIFDGAGATGLNTPYNIFVSGKYAYVASFGDNALTVIDVSDPTNPKQAGIIRDTASGGTATGIQGAISVYVLGKYAYVTGYLDNALSIIDISDPTNPLEVGTIVDGGGATEMAGPWSVYVVGRYAYVPADTDSALSIFDISNPNSPTEVGTVDDTESGGGGSALALEGATDVVVSGNYAYVTGRTDDAISVIDISDPTSPYEIATIADDNAPDGAGTATALDGVLYIAVSGKYIYASAATDDGLSVIDIAGIEAPTASIGSLATKEIQVTDDAVVGNDLFVGSGLNVGPRGIQTDGEINALLTIGTNIFANDVVIGGYLTAGASLDLTPTYIATTTPLMRIRNLTLTDPLYVKYNGAVGIGTTDPKHALHIYGDVTVSENVTATDIFVNGSSMPPANGYEWTDDGATLTPLDASRDIHVDANLSVLDNLSVNQSLFIQDGLYVGTRNLTENFVLEGGNFLQTATMTPVLLDEIEIGEDVTSVFIAGKYAYITNLGVAGSLRIIDISDPTNINQEGSYATASDAYVVKVAGQYAYVGRSAADRFLVIDISNPSNPRLTGSLDTVDSVRDIHISGRYAYCITSNNNGEELRIIDISNPELPKAVGRLEIGNTGGLSLDVQGSYLYMVTTILGGDEFHIFDISNPENPKKTYGIDIGDSGGDIDVRGKYAYWGRGNNFAIWDIANPQAPRQLSVTNFGATAYRIDVVGNYAYFVANSVFRIMDITDPEAPFVIQTPSGMDGGGIVEGKYLYWASDANAGTEFRVYDIAGIKTPSANIGSLHSGKINVANDTVVGGGVYVGGGMNVGPLGIHADSGISAGLSVGDNIFANDVVIGGYLTADASLDLTPTHISQSTALFRVRNLSLTDPIYVKYNNNVGIGTTTPVRTLHVEGDVTISESLSVTALFLSDGTSLPLVGSSPEWSDDGTFITSVDPSRDVHVDASLSVQNNLSANHSLFVQGSMSVGTKHLTESFTVEGGTFLQTATKTISEVGGIEFTANTHGLHVAGNYAYVGSESSVPEDEFSIIDISDPTNPTVVGGSGIDTDVIDVSGDYAYTGAATNLLNFFNISAPANPEYVLASNFGVDIKAVEIAGDYLLVGFETGIPEFYILNMSNINFGNNTGTYVVSTLNLANTVNDIQVQGNYAYLSIDEFVSDCFEVVDISDPTNPILLPGGITTSNGGEKLYVSGNYAYWASDDFLVVDISDPKAPSTVATINTPGAVQAIFVSGNYAYIGDTANGSEEFHIYDVSDPTDPHLVQSYEMGVGITDIVVSGKYAYVTTRSHGGNEFQILDISGFDTPSASIGTLESNHVNVEDYVFVGGTAYFGNSLNVGIRGIQTDGAISSSLTVGDSNFVNDLVIGGNRNAGASLDLTPTYTASTTPVLRVRNLTQTDPIYVRHRGTVGINNTSPESNLDISGTFRIPHTSNPSLFQDGDMALNLSDDALIIQGGSDALGGVTASTVVQVSLIKQKDFVLLEPDQLFDEIPLFTVDSYNFPNGITITAIKANTSASVNDNHNLEHWDDASGSTKTTINALNMTGVDELTINSGFSDATVPAGNYIFIDLANNTDDIDWLEISIWFYVND